MKLEYDQLSSSAIREVAYETDFGFLEVTFHHGNSYTYLGVHPEVYADLTDGRSAGEYYNAEIKGHFPVYEGNLDTLVGRIRPFVDTLVKQAVGQATKVPKLVDPSVTATLKGLEGTLQKELQLRNQQLGVVNVIRKIGIDEPDLVKGLWEFYDFLESQKHG